MDPNIQNAAPTPQPTPQPTFQSQPQTQTQPLNPIPTNNINPAPMSGQNKSKKPFIIAALATVIIAILALVLFKVMSGSAQRKVADGFMKQITTGNIDQALTYINQPDAQNRTFLQSASNSVRGSYKFKESTTKDSKYYALYDLQAGKYISARTTLEKVSGKWYLQGFVYDTKQLALIPGSSKTSTTETTPKTTATTSTLTCLVQDDYKWMNYDKQPSSVTFDATYNPAKFTNNKTADMFFKPDTTQEESFLTVYDDWADFAKHAESKQWKFRLEGSTFGSDNATAASKKLANDRALEVKAQLVKRGVSADRIIIDTPHDYSSEKQDATDKIYRRVQVVVDPTCS